MRYVTKTFNIEKGQAKALISLAAVRQLETGKYVSLSDVVREVIEAGLRNLDQRRDPTNEPA